MKHVWIVNHYALDPGEPGGTRHFSLALQLPANGWRATIIAASTTHPSGRQRLGDGEAARLQTFDGVPFLWLRAREYAGNGRARVFNILDFTRALLRRRATAELEPPDAVLGSSFHPLAAWAASRLARRHGAPFLFEVRDLWPQTPIDMGRLSPRHPMTIVLRQLERSLYRAASRILIVPPLAGDYIAPLGIARDRIVWLPNGTDARPFSVTPARAETVPGRFTLMYFGAHGEVNGLDTLIDAMRIVAASPAGGRITLRMIGGGPEKPALVAKAFGLPNIRFEDAVPRSQIPALAAEADAFVACVRNMPGLYRFGIGMNKLFDYLAAGRPTIIGVDAANNPVAEANAGITVAPEDPAALASAILAMAGLSPDARREMGQAGRRYVEANHDIRLLSARPASTLDGSLRRR